MDSLRFAIYALAVYRVSYLVAWEDGPFDILSRFRGWLNVRREGLGKFITCQYCLSFWFALAFWLLSFTGRFGDSLALILALSAVTVVLGEKT